MNDNVFVYWKLDAKEKWRRTMYMIPLVIMMFCLMPLIFKNRWIAVMIF